MDRTELIREQDEITAKLIRFQLLRNQNKRKYGTDDLIYMAEADMIMLIGNNEGIYASDIAQKLEISKSAVSKTVIKLRKKGLIKGVAHQDDSRKLLLELTPKGRIIYDYHMKLDQKVIENIMTPLSECKDEEIKAYIKIASIYVKAFYSIT